MVFVHHSPSFLQHSCLFSPSSPTPSSHPSRSLSHHDISEHGASCQRGEGGLSPRLIRESCKHFHTLRSQGLRIPSQITTPSSQTHRHKSYISSIETSVSCYIKNECITLTTEGTVEDSKIALPNTYYHSPMTKKIPTLSG